MKNESDFVEGINVAAIESDVAYQEYQLDLLDKSRAYHSSNPNPRDQG